MQNIIAEIEKEIRDVCSQEQINIIKLNELTDLLQRVKSYSASCVSDVIYPDEGETRVGETRVRAIRPGPMFQVPQQNFGLDSLKDLAEIFIKSQSVRAEEITIGSLIHCYNFLALVNKETFLSTDNEIDKKDRIKKAQEIIFDNILDKIEKIVHNAEAITTNKEIVGGK